MRWYLSVAAISSMIALPTFAQAPAQTIPDFSGLWAHPNVGWEYPVSGPGPVRHKAGATGSALLVGDDSNPVLTPGTAATIRKNSQISLSGLAFPDPDNQCMSQPVPYIFWNFEIELLQQKDKITILYNHDHDFREVRLNQAHPAKIVPSWHGDSVGHYEGDTLVVDTIGQSTQTFVDAYRTPHSDGLHVVERWKLIEGGKGLEVAITVEDPEIYYQPWQATLRYRKLPGPVLEAVCAENNLQFDYHMPVAETPDF
jgi:hypothetical protein